MNITFVKNGVSRNYSILFTQKMSEKATNTGPSIGDPSIFFIKWEFTEKTHSFVNFTNDILKIDFLENGLTDLSISILCKIYLIVF